MKTYMRLFSLGLLTALLAACAPGVSIENQVLPTLYSVTVPATRDAPVVLQGRYFGDGLQGQGADSYVILGADVSGAGGVKVNATVWSPSRIEVAIPDGAGSGFVFVRVNGVLSTGLPANLP